jgi:hypothetical protein
MAALLVPWSISGYQPVGLAGDLDGATNVTAPGTYVEVTNAPGRPQNFHCAGDKV